MHRARYCLLMACLLTGLLLSSLAAQAASGYPRHLTDLAGRHVTIDARPQRIFLLQPRQFYALMLVSDQPTRHLAGFGAPLAHYDPGMARWLTATWPMLHHIPHLARSSSAPLNVERLLALRPDLVILPLSQQADLATTQALSTLKRLGIPVLYLDFHTHPLKNTPRSLKLLGQALNRTEAASRAMALIDQHQKRLDEALATARTRPSVLLAIAPGLKVACCRTNVGTGLDLLLTRAGGHNAVSMAREGSPVINNEWVLSHPPDHIVATAGQWPDGSTVRAGIGVDRATLLKGLGQLEELPGWKTLSAVHRGHLHALWHGFHQGPFAMVALEQLAVWLHPEVTRGIDPRDTFRQLLALAGLDLPEPATFQGTSVPTP
ncbi:ABC transporter substrate-binding protein [Larsenimonas rhizosphaerae]|uniref:ABC transporter substrate-binding protein n=1 Tax=Larsenimonas rhizosphaerae TaxID=2944682 RepID=UPI0020346BF8|nr:ABC transporter substrate-binding protein [Larsenimonas rhizosphaerae]MCM2130270.1 ABC transporter substrate-binding protein [Larsenimonas rhizosphaerae]